MEITGHTATNVWISTLHQLITAGNVVYPRNLPCYEILGARTITPMRKPIVTIPDRGLGYRFMFAEAHWILTGDNRVKTIAPYSKVITQFSDNGITFFGAYGPKIVEQIPYVVHALAKDQHTRQAVINIWRENPPLTKDIPCTLSVQFLIRDGKLFCIDTMRSSDIWLGWPYDTFNFTMLSSYIILLLKDLYDINLDLGDLIMNFGSLHLYETNLIQALRCLEHESDRKFKYEALSPLGHFDKPKELLNHLQNVAEQRPEQLKSKWCHCIAEGKHNKKEKE